MKTKEYLVNNKWLISLPGNQRSFIHSAVEEWISIANNSYEKKGSFSVALSGGSTPKLIYQQLTAKENRGRIPWDKTYLFWSDERAVSPNHEESNFRMAMDEGGFSHVIKKENVFRMVAEDNIEANSQQYEEKLRAFHPLDLVMLGLGDDGHTASLFPHTDALRVGKRLVVPNFIPAKNSYRMTLTFDAINQAKNITVYVAGKGKANILEQLLFSDYKPEEFPIQRIGSPNHKAHFIIDDEAANLIIDKLHEI